MKSHEFHESDKEDVMPWFCGEDVIPWIRPVVLIWFLLGVCRSEIRR